MSIDLKVPSVGEAVVEARIARWLKTDGQSVKVDEPLIELETDKASVEVAAPSAGVLKILVPEGTTVKIGETVATIDPAGVPMATPVAKLAPVAMAAPVGSPDVIVMSPAARAMVGDAGLDAAKIAATGPGNRITKDDVLTYQAKPNGTTAIAPKAPVAIAGRETRQPMTMIRKRIAERLLESQNTTATLTTFNEADMTAIAELRTKYNEKFEKTHGVKLGFMSVFVKAAVNALKAFPMVNARIDGTDIVMQHFYDVGVAVSTEKGLMVPVIRAADTLGFSDIEKAIADVAKRARDNKITPNDMMGGTFTITNGGTFGSMLSTPILNPPQTAILGMHATQKRAVVVNDQIVIRPMMYLALSYDHRVIDGREAVQFLVRIKECVENPERMLFEI